MSSKPVVVKGKLNLKGVSGSYLKKRKAAGDAKTEEAKAGDDDNEGNEGAIIESTESGGKSRLTAAQLRHRERAEAAEAATRKKLVGSSYRERVESFNGKLARMTEHNDIPRISAAGNG